MDFSKSLSGQFFFNFAGFQNKQMYPMLFLNKKWNNRNFGKAGRVYLGAAVIKISLVGDRV